jgi:hypothetical protein
MGEDKITNEGVRRRTKMSELEDIITNRRLRWLAKVLHMDDKRPPNKVHKWNVEERIPRQNWKSVVSKDLHKD